VIARLNANAPAASCFHPFLISGVGPATATAAVAGPNPGRAHRFPDTQA
jgi:hypothetical protein